MLPVAGTSIRVRYRGDVRLKPATESLGCLKVYSYSVSILILLLSRFHVTGDHVSAARPHTSVNICASPWYEQLDSLGGRAEIRSKRVHNTALGRE